jgi:hypothetical protein
VQDRSSEAAIRMPAVFRALSVCFKSLGSMRLDSRRILAPG